MHDPARSGTEDSLAVMLLGFLFNLLCLVLRDLPQLPIFPVFVIPAILELSSLLRRFIAVSGSPVMRHGHLLSVARNHFRVLRLLCPPDKSTHGVRASPKSGNVRSVPMLDELAQTLARGSQAIRTRYDERHRVNRVGETILTELFTPLHTLHGSGTATRPFALPLRIPSQPTWLSPAR